jgi:hypothetical protein
VSIGESTTIKRLHQAFWGKAVLFARAGQVGGTQLLLSEPLEKASISRNIGLVVNGLEW